MKRFEEIRNFLTTQISREKKRLKSFGTKANSFDLANAMARHVQALMTESRHSELKRIQKVLDKQPSQGNVGKIFDHVKKRLHATKVMHDAIDNVAKDNEANRPWKQKSVKGVKCVYCGERNVRGPYKGECPKCPKGSMNKYYRKMEKHGHSRGSRSSRH